MSSQIDISRSLAIPTVLTGGGLIPLPALVVGHRLRLIVEDFDLVIHADIVDVNRRLPKITGDITLRVEAENIEGNIVLSGEETQERGFEIRELSVLFPPTEQPAAVAFVASTLNAAMKLSRKLIIQARDIGLEPAWSAFDPPLVEVSNLLRERQTAYRLMVIERATGIDFGPLPSTVPGEEVDTIAFVYRAIVERTFIDDGLRNLKVSALANEEGSRLLEQMKNSSPLTFPNENISVERRLLGKLVTLGPRKVTVSDPYIENLDRTQEEIGRGDGRQVTIAIRSHTNRARYSFLAAPTLPANPWEPAIQKLIDLDRQLDSALFERYNALAAATLADLTEEEKAQITAPVDFGAAFLPIEIHGDNSTWRRLLRFLRLR